MKLKEKLTLKYIRTKIKILSSVSKKKAAKEALKLFTTPRTRSIKPLTKNFQEAEALSFKLDKNIITGYRWNHPSAKKVLILHGYESTVVNFDAYIKPLTDKGFEVLAFDAMAHGRSSGEQINVIMYKDMIHKIDKLYGNIQFYIAHSFGGLAISLAMEEMKHDDSYKLALISPAAETETAVNNFSKLIRLNDEVKLALIDEICKLGRNPMEWYTIGRAAENIKATIRFYQDEDDFQTPMKDIKKIKKKNLPNTEFVFSKGLGHNKIYRDSGVINSIAAFLDNNNNAS